MQELRLLFGRSYLKLMINHYSRRYTTDEALSSTATNFIMHVRDANGDETEVV